HAIGTGILLAEVQQNSDTTYRVYDWGRVGLDGKKRAMHVEKSLDVIDFEGKHSTEIVEGLTFKGDGYEETHYVANAYFALDQVAINTYYKVDKEPSLFELYMCIEGEMTVHCEANKLTVAAGDSFMIPACITHYEMKGSGKLIKTYVPKSVQKCKDDLALKGFSAEAIQSKTAMML
ncbi:MAG: mannose-6-phosphate isomerase, partial [Vallitaleaceae bacterium]|nr:mannose-6-phosphate isomerase [Vallitaleaceae bacterium]